MSILPCSTSRSWIVLLALTSLRSSLANRFGYRSSSNHRLLSLTTTAFLINKRPSRTLSFGSSAIQSRSTSSGSEMSSTTKRVLVPIADGSEEIETTCITDTLTRFGAEVTVVSVKPNRELLCTMSRGIKIQADCSIDDVVGQEWDLIACPGGMPGAQHLRDCEPLVKLLTQQKEQKKLYGAICAAPAVVLATAGLVDQGAASTCFPVPKFREVLGQVATVSDERVVVTDNLVTSQGPGTALLFGLELGEKLFGKEKRDEIAKQLLIA